MSTFLEGFQFSEGDSFIHRLDPRSKMVWSAGLTILALIFSDIISQFALLLLVFLFTSLAGVTKKLLHTLRSLLFVMIFIGILETIYIDVVYALSICLRLTNLAITFSILFLTTHPDDLGTAITKLGAPYTFSFILVTSTRYVPVLFKEAKDISDAWQARGIELEKSRWKLKIFTEIKKYIMILVPLVVSSVRRSLRLAEAMEARAFGAGKRTSLRDLKMMRRDYIVVALSIIFTIIGIVIVVLYTGALEAITYNYYQIIVAILFPYYQPIVERLSTIFL